VEAAKRILEIDRSLETQMKQGIDYMLEKEDISRLCKAFGNGHKEERGSREVIQGEVTFQEGTLLQQRDNNILILVVCFNRLLVCRKLNDSVFSEYGVSKKERDSKGPYHSGIVDIMYKDNEGHRRFCFELKNIRVEDLEIGMEYGQRKDWDELKDLSDKIAEMEDQDVLALKLKPKHKSPQWFQSMWASTVGEFMDNTCKYQLGGRYKDKLQADDEECGRSLAWVVTRVGLGKVLCKKVFPFNDNEEGDQE
jgi:hypothetical protein